MLQEQNIRKAWRLRSGRKLPCDMVGEHSPAQTGKDAAINVKIRGLFVRALDAQVPVDRGGWGKKHQSERRVDERVRARHTKRQRLAAARYQKGVQTHLGICPTASGEQCIQAPSHTGSGAPGLDLVLVLSGDPGGPAPVGLAGGESTAVPSPLPPAGSTAKWGSYLMACTSCRLYMASSEVSACNARGVRVAACMAVLGSLQNSSSQQ